MKLVRFKKIYIEITNICNLKCSFCPVDNLVKREMNLDEFTKILKEIKPYTKYIYLHVKGEPLIHSKFEEIINAAIKEGFKINITTNATLLHRHKEILKKVRQINVSLQSFTNINKLNNIIEDLEELSKTTYISYRFWARTSHEKQILNIINERYKEILPKNIFLSYDDEFIWPDLNNQIMRTNGTCKGTIDHIAILVDGTVIPCCLDSKGVINLGNIHNENLEDILNSNRFINMNNSFKENKLCEELCTKCGFFK